MPRWIIRSASFVGVLLLRHEGGEGLHCELSCLGVRVALGGGLEDSADLVVLRSDLAQGLDCSQAEGLGGVASRLFSGLDDLDEIRRGGL